jgi:hypothetical protein
MFETPHYGINLAIIIVLVSLENEGFCCLNDEAHGGIQIRGNKV